LWPLDLLAARTRSQSYASTVAKTDGVMG